MKEAKVANIISDRTTMEYAMERMSRGFPVISPNPSGGVKVGVETATLIVSTELSVFISASQFTISCLSALWDTNEEDFQYGTRGKGEWNIHKPYVGLLGASAPDWLVKSIPADAVGGGFTRRVNFVFATKKDKKVPWPSRNGSAAYPMLVSDLKEISRLAGQFNFTDKARGIFEPYYNSCEPNEFDDEATAVYKNSKWANASKLAMCLSASRGDSMEINEVDLQHAIDLTEDVAGDLKVIFRAVGESELVSGQDKVIRFIESRGYASRQEILALNFRHITGDDLDRIIATLREAGYLIEVVIGKKTMYKLASSISTTIPVTP